MSLNEIIFENSQEKQNPICAFGEWDISNEWEDEEKEATCLCGQEGLKQCFEISNRFNGNTLSVIGSQCINRFGTYELKEQLTVACYGSTIMKKGKYEGMTFRSICKHYPSYVRFLKQNSKLKTYEKLIKYFDLLY